MCKGQTLFSVRYFPWCLFPFWPDALCLAGDNAIGEEGL
jgi:hypothetical protein